MTRSPARRYALRALALAGVGLAAPGARAAPIELRDDSDAGHRFDAPPRRIVSMMPSLTEVVSVLGGGPRLVGVDRFSDWPAEIARLPRLGGLEDARIEAIVALRPDVVLASTSSRAMQRLDALGVVVLRLKSDGHADVRRTLGIVARLLGAPDEGERVWARVERGIDAAAARVPAAMRGRRVYFEVGGGAYAAGTTSFIGETLARLGLSNVVPPGLGPFPKLNPEFVVRAAPDVVMGPRRDVDTMPARPGWSDVPAVRHRRLCGFEPADYDLLVRPGPRIGEAAGRLADCLAGLDAAAPR